MKVKKWLLGLVTFAAMAVLCAVCAGAETYGDLEYGVLDDGTVEITDYNGSAEKVDIPAKIDGMSVTSIGDWAFSSCASLTSITIPNSVTSIGASAFYYCKSLTSITIPNSVTSIDVNAFGDTALLENQATAEKYVGKWVVECDNDVSSVTIKNGTEGIADSAFEDCTSLTSITIPNSVTSIGISAFRGCTSLTSITIPNSVTSIDEYAFSVCTSLISITIPDSVTSIGKSAFYYCVSLTSITIPDSVTSIGAGAFEDCERLESITIPDAVTSIESGTFRDCDKLTDITIPDNVTSIGWGAFSGCESLTSIMLPNDMKEIGVLAFSYCVSLRNITIPDGVTSIGLEAFKCCGLTSITIPDSVTDIGDRAFGFSLTSYSKIDNFKIYCYSNTAGEQYAKDNGFTYELLDKPTLAKVTGAKLGGRAADALRINWTKNASADGYIVEMYQGNKWVRVAKITSNNTTTFRKAGLKAGTAYKFRVRAYKMSGKTAVYSEYSATVAARTNPSVMTGAKLGGRAADALRINWTKNASADGYIVEMYQNGKWTRVAKITSHSTTTFRKAGLKAGTAYKFRVRAYKMSGNTAVYGAYSATVAARTNPSVIKGAKLTGRAADALRINWAKNASADGYIVEMYQGNKWVRVGKITNNSTTTFRKAGLKASSVYKFRVRAYKMSGKTALYGNYSATVTTRTNPSIVKGVKIAGKAKDALRVNWAKNASAQGYIVEMYKSGKWVRVAKITNGNTTTFRKAGLAKNTAYKFRVRAYHMSGKTALYGNYGSVSGKTAAK